MTKQKHFLFGIRHHGPGSAAALHRALQNLQPDRVLIEGPPDGSAMIPWLAHEQMVLPAALLIYRPDQPKQAAYYPFTDFSPETAAMRYALAHDLPVCFADLPQKHLMAVEARPSMPGADVFETLSRAAGHPSYEAWWNLVVEQRRENSDLFVAVMELMTAVRAEAEANEADGGEGALWARRREAAMRQAIRAAVSNGAERIAFICGAWHAPALRDLHAADRDRELLAGLPEVVVEATWVPWTYGRLSLHSGYGAGIQSPGWYEHIWQRGQAGDSVRQTAAGWLARVAALLREQGFFASPAHVIEAVRLAEALASLRGLPFPGLAELNEATVSVLCEGASEPMATIKRKLIVGERLGLVPPGTPMVPLQRDLLRLQKELALHPNPEPSALRLDLRQELDLARSRLLHRLRLLSVPWGAPARRRGLQTDLVENWKLSWLPDFPLRLIEASPWGNTIEDAASAWVAGEAAKTKRLADLTTLLDRVFLADLPGAVSAIVARIEDESAVSSDIPHMMAALPPLVRVLRYGSARQTQQDVLQRVVDTLLTRICIGLPSTCATMDDEPAQKMAGQLAEVNMVVHTLREQAKTDRWHEALASVLAQPGLHGLLDGRISRLLLDDDVLSGSQAAQRMERALRRGTSAALTSEQAAQSAAWLDGFLEGSELLLIHDRRLWAMLDGFVNRLPQDRFVEILPLLRRAFARYSEAARRQLQERVRQGVDAPLLEMPVYADFDHDRAAAVLPHMLEILGLTGEDV